MELRDTPTPTAPSPPPGTPVTRCLNCGTDLHGAFCHVCGQERVDHNLSLGRLLRDFLGDLFSFDGRLARTLRPLFLRPGVLTQRYVSGHRAPYVPPVRLYVFSSFLMFLVIAVLQINLADAMVSSSEEARRERAPEALTAAERTTIETRIDSLERLLQAAPAPSDPRTAAPDAPETPDARVTSEAEAGWFSRFLKAQGHRVDQDSDAFEAFLGRQTPVLLFLLVPLLALELKLLYLRRNGLYVHHLIFSLHFQAFVFGLLTALLLGARLVEALTGFDTAWMLALMALAPLYLLVALKRVYGRPWGKTVLTFVVLGALHSIGFMLAFALFAFVLVLLF